MFYSHDSLLKKRSSWRCVKPDDVSDELFAPVFDIFNSCGKAAVVEEKDISAVTALSGSGPAYFFKFARAALEEAGFTVCAADADGSYFDLIAFHALFQFRKYRI